MTDTWRNQAIPVETQSWREQAVPSEAPSLPVKWVGGKGGAVKYNVTPQEELLSTTSVGRIMDAFGQGAEEGWGSEPLGFSPESMQTLKDIGLFTPNGPDWTEPGRTFNEALLVPTAGAVDSFFRLFPTVIRSGASGLGQIGEEIGLFPQTEGGSDGKPVLVRSGVPEGEGEAGVYKEEMRVIPPHKSHAKERFVDSIEEFINVGGIVAMGEPAFMGVGINTAKAQKSTQAIRDVVEEVEKPADMLAPVPAPGAVARKIEFPENGKVFDVPILDAAGEQAGTVIGNVGHDRIQITNTGILADADRGKGFAIKAYEEIADAAIAEGKTLDSDTEVTLAAARLYEGLERRGYTVERNPNAKLEDGKWVAPGSSWGVFRVTDKPKAAETPKQASIAQPIPPKPAGISPEFVKSDGVTIDTAKITEMKDVYDAMEEFSQANQGWAPLATRGKVTWAETEAAAQEFGVNPALLFQRKIGDAWNSTQLQAAVTMAKQGAKEAIEAGRKARATGSDADMIAAAEAKTRAELMLEAFTGVKTEAGRSMNILKKFKQEAQEVEGLSAVLKELGGRDNLEGYLEALKRMDNAEPGQINKFIMDMQKPGAVDMALEYVYNAMLSGPTTHMANIIGNSLAQLWRVTETGLAGAIHTPVEGLYRALGAKPSLAGDRVYMGESGAKLWGMLQGFPEGLKAAYKTIRTGDPANVSKLETRRMRKVTLPSGQKVEVPVENRKAIPGPVGTAIRVPGTLLMAEDEVFQAMAYRANLQALAYRSASKKGLKGQAFADHVAKKVNNPTKEMMEKARAESDYVTFTKELGKTGKFLQKLGEQHPIAKVVVAPFIRAPINLIKFPLERTVFSMFSRDVFDKVAGKHGAAARDETLAKIILGTGITAGAYMAAAAGRMTGAGPSDPVERQMWLLAGNQPYSVRVGDTWYSYARIEPIATLLGISADAYYINDKLSVDEAANIGTLLAYSASQNISNKTFLKGMTDFTDAFISDPERYMQNYVENLSTRFVPAIAGQVARAEDPYLRDARSILEAYKTRLPGKSDEVYPHRDIFGNALKRGGSAGPDFGSPIFTTTVTNDPIVKELYNIPGAWPAKVQRQIRGVELDSSQYDDYQRISGRLTYMNLQQLFNTPGWSSIPEGVKTEVVTKKINQARETARTYMLFQHQDILKKSMELKRKHLLGE